MHRHGSPPFFRWRSNALPRLRCDARNQKDSSEIYTSRTAGAKLGPTFFRSLPGDWLESLDRHQRSSDSFFLYAITNPAVRTKFLDFSPIRPFLIRRDGSKRRGIPLRGVPFWGVPAIYNLTLFGSRICAASSPQPWRPRAMKRWCAV